MQEGLSDVGLWHVLEHLGQSGQHPAVAACPVVFLAVGRLVLGPHVLTVAEVEARLGVEHDAVAVEQVLVELVEIFLLARQAVHLCHHGQHHVEGVGPPPVVGLWRVGLVAHHLAGTGNHL